MLSRDDEVWQATLEELKEYERKNKHCRVPRSYISDTGISLGQWVTTQRVKYAKGTLRQDRINALNELGFSFNPKEGDWQEKFELLEQYKEENGNCVVPMRHKVLGQWVKHQRHMYRKNTLPDHRITKFNSIGFVWDAGSFKKNTGRRKRVPSFIVESPPPIRVPPTTRGRAKRNNGANSSTAQVTPDSGQVTPNNRRKNVRKNKRDSNSETSSPETSSPAPKRRKTANDNSRAREMDKLRKLLAQRDKTIAEQKSTISELEEENHQKDVSILELDEAVSELEEENQSKDEAILQLVKENMGTILANRSNEIMEPNQNVDEMADLRARVTELERQRQQLQWQVSDSRKDFKHLLRKLERVYPDIAYETETDDEE